MEVAWQPYREPLRATLVRTGVIAGVLGVVIAFTSGCGLRDWPAAVLLALWPALGGHFVELVFLNQMRPTLPLGRGAQAAARLATWFVGGCLLAAGMYATANAIHKPFASRGETWWIGGIAFIAIELIAHLGLQLRGRGSFYNGGG